MTPAEALKLIQDYATFGRVYIIPHARKQMYNRGAKEDDVYRAIETATDCKVQTNERWKVTGIDWDNDELTMIVEIEGSAVVVTIF